MKIIIYAFLLLLLPVIGFSQLKWEAVTNVERGYDTTVYLEVFFLKSDPHYGWISGYDGRTLRTTDSGYSWHGSTVPLDIDTTDGTILGGQLESIFFVNNRVGYTSGSGQIFKSTNGGASWRNVTPDSSGGLWGNYFLDENNGVAVGAGCRDTQNYFRTTNGGATWKKFKNMYYGAGLSDPVLFKDGTGYASGSGNIFKTTDFGATWSFYSKSGGSDWQEDLWVLGNTILVPYNGGCLGSFTGGGGARISTDLGKTWKEQSFGQPMFGAFLQNSTNGWCVGWDGAVYFTNNGGGKWILSNCGIEDKQLDDIYFVNDTLGYVVGNGIFRSKAIHNISPKLTISGPTTICDGDILYLELKGTYNTYNWSNGESTRRIFPKSSGKYWCTVSNSPCEAGTTDTVDITIYPSPKLSLSVEPDSVACEGDTIKLKINSTFPQVRWSNNGEISDSIYVNKSGVYSVQVINEFGCPALAEKNIIIHPKPKPKIFSYSTAFCNEDSITLNADQDYFDYIWYRDGSEIAHGTNSITIKDSGNYSLKAFNSFCSDTSASIKIDKIFDKNRLSIEYFDVNKDYYEFNPTNLLSLNCQGVKIKNNSTTEPFSVDKALLARNIDFSLPPSQFPMILDPWEERELIICFSPKVLAKSFDTLFLGDKCTPHFLPLLGLGKPNYYTISSECGTELMAKSIKLDKYWYSFGSLRNWNEVVSVKFKAFHKKGQTISIEVYDAFGSKAAIGNYKIENSTSSNGECEEQGEISADLSNLPNGVYIIVIRTPLGIFSEKTTRIN